MPLLDEWMLAADSAPLPEPGGILHWRRAPVQFAAAILARGGDNPNPRTATMNALQLLKDDHKKILGLLAELEATTSRGQKKRGELLARIAHELEVHTSIEEKIFYPAFRDAGQKVEDAKMYFEALEEHRAATNLVLPDLLRTSPTSEQFGGRAKVLRELIEQHVGEEEKTMFPRARKLLDAMQLQELGERMAARKLELKRSEKAGMLAKGGSKLLEGGSKLMESLASIVTPEGVLPLGQTRNDDGTQYVSPAARGHKGDKHDQTHTRATRSRQ
jgi:hemerythrin-like domain-containing protein